MKLGVFLLLVYTVLIAVQPTDEAFLKKCFSCLRSQKALSKESSEPNIGPDGEDREWNRMGEEDKKKKEAQVVSLMLVVTLLEKDIQHHQVHSVAVLERIKNKRVANPTYALSSIEYDYASPFEKCAKDNELTVGQAAKMYWFVEKSYIALDEAQQSMNHKKKCTILCVFRQLGVWQEGGNLNKNLIKTLVNNLERYPSVLPSKPYDVVDKKKFIGTIKEMVLDCVDKEFTDEDECEKSYKYWHCILNHESFESYKSDVYQIRASVKRVIQTSNSDVEET